MLQNKLLFSQSTVSFEVVGLPDYSNNENKDQISIISKWKLMIIDKPPIEGNFDHLSEIMNAFYNYSNLLFYNDSALFESKLIDIKTDNFFTHIILLKSSKPNVEPLRIKIGNLVLSDIINCFDQYNSSNKVKKIDKYIMNNFPKRIVFNLLNKEKIYSVLLTPLLSICSLFIISTPFIYFYNLKDDQQNNSLIHSNINIYSTKTTNTIL